LEGLLLAASRVDTAPPESFALKAKLRKSVVSLHHKSSVDLMLHVELGDLAATNVQHLQHF